MIDIFDYIDEQLIFEAADAIDSESEEEAERIMHNLIAPIFEEVYEEGGERVSESTVEKVEVYVRNTYVAIRITLKARIHGSLCIASLDTLNRVVDILSEVIRNTARYRFSEIEARVVSRSYNSIDFSVTGWRRRAIILEV